MLGVRFCTNTHCLHSVCLVFGSTSCMQFEPVYCLCTVADGNILFSKFRFANQIRSEHYLCMSFQEAYTHMTVHFYHFYSYHSQVMYSQTLQLPRRITSTSTSVDTRFVIWIAQCTRRYLHFYRREVLHS